MSLPGFVDLQVNGCRGTSFSDPDLDAPRAREAFRHILASGATAFLPTVITSAPEIYEKNLPLLIALMREEEFAGRVLGLHVEGPFISPEPGAVGAHHPESVREPDCGVLDRLQELAAGDIRLLTMAAERPGADRLCRHAVGMGISVSLGHQLAMEEDLARLADAGARALTHLGNGVPNLLPRHPNPIWAGIAEDRLVAMIIADGHHLPDSVLKTVIRAKGPDRVIAVSDASCMAGMKPGEYQGMGNRIVLEASGRLWNPDKGCLVGSSAMLIDCMNHLARQKWLDLEDLLAMGFYNPLALINIDAAEVDGAARLEYDAEAGFLPI